MKKIRLTDILLLSVAGILDIFQEFKDPGDLISNYYQNFYGFVPQRWKKTNYTSLVSHMVQSKKIIKIKKYKKYTYKITTKGQNHLEKKLSSLKFYGEKWDKKWRIMIFDIEEINRGLRDLLRKKIKEFGFGYLQKSVWISPYNVFPKIKKFIHDNKLENNIILFESEKLSLNNEKIVKIVWPIKEIEERYCAIYEQLLIIKQRLKNQEKITTLRISFNNSYRKLAYLLFEDPHLPYKLLPITWPYFKTIKLAKKLKVKFIRTFGNDRV
ncbi:MAG: PaaX family transcriptional regulator C-terminal domain-containing protein [bacterium]